MPRPSTITGIALISAPAGTERSAATSTTVVRPGVGPARVHRGKLAGQPLAPRGSDLNVGGVAGSQRDLVLARGAGRHVLMGARTSHHADVGLDPIPAQPQRSKIRS